MIGEEHQGKVILAGGAMIFNIDERKSHLTVFCREKWCKYQAVAVV